VLTERPEEAGWLTAAEREALVACLREEAVGGSDHAGSGGTVGEALSSGRLWLLAAVYFTIPVALYAFGFFLPQILRESYAGSDFRLGVLTAIPYLAGAIGMVITSRHSDRTGERRWHVA